MAVGFVVKIKNFHEITFVKRAFILLVFRSPQAILKSLLSDTRPTYFNVSCIVISVILDFYTNKMLFDVYFNQTLTVHLIKICL
jgi:hypothetical protein